MVSFSKKNIIYNTADSWIIQWTLTTNTDQNHAVLVTHSFWTNRHRPSVQKLTDKLSSEWFAVLSIDMPWHWSSNWISLKEFTISHWVDAVDSWIKYLHDSWFDMVSLDWSSLWATSTLFALLKNPNIASTTLKCPLIKTELVATEQWRLLVEQCGLSREFVEDALQYVLNDQHISSPILLQHWLEDRRFACDHALHFKSYIRSIKNEWSVVELIPWAPHWFDSDQKMFDESQDRIVQFHKKYRLKKQCTP